MLSPQDRLLFIRITLHGICAKTFKAFFSRIINHLLTKLARDRTGRISALGLFCTDLAALGPYCQDLGPIFSQYGPRAWLIRYIYIGARRNGTVFDSIFSSRVSVKHDIGEAVEIFISEEKRYSISSNNHVLFCLLY